MTPRARRSVAAATRGLMRAGLGAAWIVAVTIGAGVLASRPAQAQVAPVTPAASAPGSTVQSMIDTLQQPVRSRNLVVRQRAEPVAVAGPATPVVMPAAATAAVVAPAPPVTSAAAPAAPAGAAEAEGLALQLLFAGTRLRPESGPVLGDLLAALQSPELRERRFLIEGQADTPRPGEAARRQAHERAEEVRAYLVTLGVAPARLVAVGRGAGGDGTAGRVRVIPLDR